MPLFQYPRTQQVDSSGNPLSGGKLSFFETDGTTAKAVYQDEDLSTPHTQPVVADSAGRWVPIYVSGAYKVRLTDANDGLISLDQTSQSGLDDAYYEEITGNGSQTAFTLSEDLGTDEKVPLIQKPDGTFFKPEDFTINGTLLTFDSPPAAGSYQVRAPSLNLGAASSFAAAAEAAAAQAESYAIAVIGGGAVGDITTLDTATPATDDYFIISDVSDSNINKKSLISAILSLFTGQNNTFTKAQRASQTALTSTSNSIAIDFSANNDFTHTMTEHTTLENPTNIAVGQSGCIVFTQDASSAYTLAVGSYFKQLNNGSDTITDTLSGKSAMFYQTISATEIVYTIGEVSA